MIKKSLAGFIDNAGQHGERWIEKCRCGRTVLVHALFNLAGSDSPKMSKDWFDRFGVFERHTGTQMVDIPKTVDNASV